MTAKFLVRGLTALAVFFISIDSSAQVINMYHPNAAPQVGYSRAILNNASVAFSAYPASGSGAATMTFTINNTSATNLVLSGAAPWVTISGGTNPADFVVTSAPGSNTIPNGGAQNFTITYTPTTDLVETAILTIASNATNTPNFIINLKGPARRLYGALNPPYGTSTITTTPTNPLSCLSPYTGIASPCIGRAGGLTYNISAVALAGRTTTYWGPEISTNGNLQLRLSLNGNVHGDNSDLSTTGFNNDREVFTYDAVQSNLAAGSVYFTGTSTRFTVNFGRVTSPIRCILTVKKADNVTPYILTDPTSIGLSEQVGGLVQLTGTTAADDFHANYKVESFDPHTGTWRPYLDYYDDNSWYQNSCGVCAFISVSSGFYWNNLAPRNTANNPLVVAEGGTGTILSPANLNISDDEDLPAFPNRIIYNFNSNPILNFGTGIMRKAGVPMTPATTFTLQDLQNSLITYTHDGSESIGDQFQFSARDSRGALMNDGNPANTNFSFGILITPVNDVPVTRDTAFTTSFVLPITRNLVAYDPDLPGDPIVFSIVTAPTKGTISGFNSTTGQFTYTPTFGAPTVDNFTFRVFDGTVFSNTSTVTINQVNLPPTVSNSSIVTREDVPVSGTLTAVDPEGSAVSFNIITAPAKGTLTVFNSTTGAFTYTPTLTKFGADYFTFKAQDAQGGLSVEDTVFVRIIPRLDPGDILVMDQTLVRLYDPATAQDTVITRNQGLTGGINLAYKKGTSIFMFDQTNGLIKADPLTGVQSMVAPRGGFSAGAPIGGPAGMLINNTGKLILADASNGIVSVDSTTGVITSLFSGGLMSTPTSLVYLNNGDLILTNVAGGPFGAGTSKIMRITPAGVQSQIAAGGLITVPLDLAVIDQNTVVVSDAGSFFGGADNIYKVNLTTGAVTPLSTGGSIAIPSGLDYRLNKLYVANKNGTKRVLDIDPVTGVQIILPGTGLTNPWGLMIVADPMIVTATTTDETCAGSNNGTAVITFIGGVAPFSYTLDGGATIPGVSSPFTITGLTPGAHTVVVYDNAGSSGSVNFTIAAGNPLPVAAATPSSQTICSASPITTIVLSSNIGGTTYTWTRDNTVAVTGIAANGIGDISGSLTNTTSAPVIVTFTIIATANGCPGAPITATVTVNPTPNVDQPANQVVCNGAPTVAVNFSGNTSGTLCATANEGGSITLNAPPGTVITAILFASYGTPNGVCGSFTIGGCHASNSMSIVSALAVGQTSVTIPANNTTFGDPCGGTPKRLYVEALYTSTNTTYNWTNNAPGIGLAASGSGNIGSFTATNPGTTPVVASITVTPTYTNGGTTCTGSPITFTITVNPTPSATISYTGSPYCQNAGTATVTQTGTTGGTFSSTAGLTINAATGDVNLGTSTAGTYMVTYTIPAAGGCGIFTTTTSITITALPAATISYAGSPYCSNAGTATVTRTGTAGGTYSSTAGLTLNATTGDVTLGTSTPGTYTVTYTIAASGGCPDVITTTTITITELPVATIIYTGSPYCQNAGTAVVTQTGTTGGTYSSTAGLTINATTGDVILGTSTPGTYTVTYTIAAGGGCPVVTATTTITITTPPAATISYPGSPYCSNAGTANVTRTGTAGGTYSSTAGLTLNASTGAVTLGTSTPGTYTVTYTIAAAGGCPVFTTTASITITAAPAATISYAGSPYCSTDLTATVTRTGTAGGTYSSTAGLTINATTGTVTPSTSTPGTYTVTYTIAAGGGCGAFSTTTTITITQAPNAIIFYLGTPYCSNAGTATVSQFGTPGGTYSAAPAGLTINATTGAVTLATSTPGTYTVTYTIPAGGGCGITITTTTITITAAPAATISYAGSPYCANAGTANVTRTGTAGGTYSSTPGLTLNATTGAVTLGTSTPGTYVVTYTIAASGGCATFTTTASITITALPAATIAYTGSPYCSNAGTATVTRTGTAGGTYSAAPAGLVINATTGDVNLGTSTAGTYTVTYTLAAGGGCPVVTATTTITITTLPAATISYTGSPYCQNAGTATVTRTGTAGGTYSAAPAGLSINATTGLVTLGTSTPGTYTVTYTIAAGGGCGVVTATTSITVSSLSVAPTGATASSTSLCGPTAITLSVTGGSLGSGATWRWYTGSCGGTLVGTGATLNLTVSATTTYYVRAEGPCNTTTCASVTVTVNVQPTVVLTATLPTSLMPGQTSTLTATVTPADPTNTTVWYRNGIVVPGATGLTRIVGVDALGLYTVRTTTTAGCTALSNAVLIKDSASAPGTVWIYPNPNSGQFSIRYYSNAQQLGFVRHVILYNQKGQKVWDETYPITGPYSNMNVDARKLPSGTYIVVLTDAFKNEILAKGSVVIVR